MTSQFIIEIDGAVQQESNRDLRKDCELVLQSLPEHIIKRSRIVEYVEKEDNINKKISGYLEKRKYVSCNAIIGRYCSKHGVTHET